MVTQISKERTAYHIAFAVICVFVVVPVVIASNLDTYSAKFVHSLSSDIKGLFAAVVFLGSPLGYLVGAALGVVIFRYVVKSEVAQNYSLFFFVAVAGSGLVADIFKIIFWRARPGVTSDQGFEGFFYFSFSGSLSFPSGHSAVAAAVAAALSIALPRATPILVLMPLSVGLSRLVVGAHYFSDVIAGLAIGALSTFAIRSVLVRRNWWVNHCRN